MTPAEVTAASNAWLWLPDDATSYDVAGSLLVRYPDWFADPLMVVRTSAYESGAVGAVLDRARGLAGHLVWWVKLDAPAGLEDDLRAAGGRLVESADVLAAPVTDRPVVVPDGLELRWRTDLPTRRDGYAVDLAVFGGELPADEVIAEGVPGERAEIGQGLGGGLVAYLAGEPVGSGGVSLVDGVARMWGGGVLESARRRGVYAALLAGRLAYAHRFGATMALVKGRVDTSGPILRRAGFTAYGRERGYRFEL